MLTWGIFKLAIEFFVLVMYLPWYGGMRLGCGVKFEVELTKLRSVELRRKQFKTYWYITEIVGMMESERIWCDFFETTQLNKETLLDYVALWRWI